MGKKKSLCNLKTRMQIRSQQDKDKQNIGGNYHSKKAKAIAKSRERQARAGRRAARGH